MFGEYFNNLMMDGILLSICKTVNPLWNYDPPEVKITTTIPEQIC